MPADDAPPYGTTIKMLFKLRDPADGEFVYDIETGAGIFNAGIGSLTVKNTDSSAPAPCLLLNPCAHRHPACAVMMRFLDPTLTRAEAWRRAKQIEASVNKVLPGLSHCVRFDSSWW